MKKIIFALLFFFLSGEILWGASIHEVKISALNVRSGPSTQYRAIGVASTSQRYVALDNQGGWVKIWYSGTTGWLSAQYLSKVTSGQIVEITAYYLNVRSGPGTGYSVVGQTQKPAQYVVMGTSGSWAKVWFAGSARWVYGASGYGVFSSISAPAPTPTPTPTFTSSASGGTFDQIRQGAVLKRGDQGTLVKELQKRLNTMGFYLSADGIFGAGTERQLKSFQKATGVQTTGQFGATTLQALEWAEKTIASHSQGTGTAYSSGQNLGTIKLIYIDGKPVEIRTALSYLRMSQAAAQSGVTLKVVSGFRTYAEQKYLYQLYLNGQGNLAAKPGYSNHQNGLALDLNTSSSGVLSWLNKNGSKNYFLRTVPSEDWHWEYRP